MKRKNFIFISIFLISIAGCGGGGWGTGSPASPPNQVIPGITDIQQDFVGTINLARSSGRLCGSTFYPAAPPVEWNFYLAMAAYGHSLDMASNQFFDHLGSDGSLAGERITQAGYAWSIWGENIAVGYPTVADVIGGWLASEGHCRNIMDPAFAEIGAGYMDGTYLGIPNSRYWTFDLATGQ